MKEIPEGYTIQVSNLGRLQAWFQGKPLIPDMWWSAHQRWGAIEDCYRDLARRTAVNVEQVQTRLEQEGQNELTRLLDDPFELQVHICLLLSRIDTNTHNLNETTGWWKKACRAELKTDKNELKRAVRVAQELQLYVPHTHTWLA